MSRARSISVAHVTLEVLCFVSLATKLKELGFNGPQPTAAIELHFYQKERGLLRLQETITLYDLTNTYFEGQSKRNAFGSNGHSQEKRADCPLVILALVLDSSGLPRRIHVYESNVSAPKTLAEML